MTEPILEITINVACVAELRATCRSPAFLRRMMIGTPFVVMDETPLPVGRRLTAPELRAWQEVREASSVVIHGTFLIPGGDA